MSLAGETECEGDVCKPIEEEKTPGRVEKRTREPWNQKSRQDEQEER